MRWRLVGGCVVAAISFDSTRMIVRCRVGWSTRSPRFPSSTDPTSAAPPPPGRISLVKFDPPGHIFLVK